MKKEKLFRRSMAVAMSVLMMFGTATQAAMASDEVFSILETETAFPEEQSSQETETGMPGDNAEEGIILETEASEPVVSETEGTESIPDTESTEAEETGRFTSIAEDSLLTESQLEKIDFSSRRLLIAGADSLIIDPEDELSSYDGVHLMQYKDAVTAKYAYSYYYGKAAFVDVDSTLSIATGEETGVSGEMTENDNPISELADAAAGTAVYGGGSVIALIDTGVSGCSNVIQSVSMIGDDTSDGNGHGSHMAELIVQENPDAQIISIKALGADGTGDASAIYAAVRYAMEAGAGIINLSVSAPKRSGDAAVASAIAAANAQGIRVVAAAGNNGNDAYYYTPGGLSGVLTIGAADENGSRLSSSNYGSCVEYYVAAGSTSEAAAIYSGLLSDGKGSADNVLVFSPDYQPDGDPEPEDASGLQESINALPTAEDYDALTEEEQVKARETVENLQKEYEALSDADKEEVDPSGLYALAIYLNAFANQQGDIDDGEAVPETERTTEKMSEDELMELQEKINALPDLAEIADVSSLSATAEDGHVLSYSDPDINLLADRDEIDSLYERVVSLTEEYYSLPEEQMMQIDAAKLVTLAAFFSVGVNVYSTASVGTVTQSYYVTYGGRITGRYPSGGYFNVQTNNTGSSVVAFCGDSYANTPAAGAALVSESEYTGTGADALKVILYYGYGGPGEIVPHDMNGYLETHYAICQALTGWSNCYDLSSAAYKLLYTDIEDKSVADLVDVWFAYTGVSSDQQLVYAVFHSQETGYLRAQKKAADTAFDTSCYSMDGIQFQVFTDEACTAEAVDSEGNAILLTAGKNGKTEAVCVADGTYYVREVASSLEGKGWVYNPTPVKVTVQGETEENAVIATVENLVNMDPIGLILKKVDAVTGKAAAVTDGSLAGAQYRLDYYAGETAEGEPEASWVFETNQNGFLYYDEDYKVSGPDLYTSEDGIPALPVGTITIQEIKASKGYLVNEEIFTVHLTAQSDGTVRSDKGSWNTTNAVEDLDIISKEQETPAPVLHTSARDGKTGTQEGTSEKKAEVIDTVTFSNLNDGERYILEGTLHYADTGETVTGTDGKDCIVTLNITCDASVEENQESEEEVTVPVKGNVDMPAFIFDASELGGRSVVVTEVLKNTNGDTIAEHADLTDKDQTVSYLTGHTNAADSQTNDHAGTVGETVEIVDTVSYENLQIGKEYTVSGTLHYKSDFTDADGNAHKAGDKVTGANGKTITAEKTFTAEKADGTIDLTYSLDSRLLAGAAVVVFEDFYSNGVEVYAHESLEDEDQTIWYPSVHTTALDSQTKEHVGNSAEQSLITDKVQLGGLITGDTYMVSGTLMDQDTGKELLDENGNAIRVSSKEFTADSSDMEVLMTFKLPDAAQVSGKTIVVFESLYHNDVEVASHKDLDDADQSVSYPGIHTEATAEETGDHTLPYGEKVTVKDQVSYTGLIAGKEYTVSGVLMNKETGEELLLDGKTVTVEKTFTAEKADGTVDLEFTFDSTVLNGASVVAFETLKYGKIEVAVHADINDKDQTVTPPQIQTTATDQKTGDHIGCAGEEMVIVDQVSYTGLTKGKEYTVSGVLMDQKTGEELLVNGKRVTAEKTFVPEETDGIVELEFTFDSTAIAGTSVVAFETVKDGDAAVAVHTDINDQGQTVTIPEIHTTAEDEATGDHSGHLAEDMIIIDTVKYSGLIVGKEYTVSGVLMNKETGEELTVNGKNVTAEKTFTAEKADGTVELEFTFDSTALEGTAIVAFETVTYKNITVGVHADIHDKDQTVTIPEIHTTAADKDTEDHTGSYGEAVTIIDTVTYTGLTAGKEYTLSGVLMNQETGEELLVNGSNVTAEKTFTPEDTDGTVEMEFTFDSMALAGTSVVAFETVKDKDITVAVHTDINDKDQTVTIPEIHTTAADKDTEDHDGHLGEEITIVDQVSYTGLIAGKEYTVSGVLMNQETGEELLVGGQTVAAEKTFTAEETDGTVELEFTFDSTALAGTSAVAFETMTYNGIKVAVHADINDQDQTVNFPSAGTKASDKKNGTQTMTLGKNVVLTDTLSYKGLTPGKEYTLKGEVMDKATGKSIGVTAEAKFTPDQADGETEIEFTLNTSNMEGKTLVVFESVFDAKGNLIAEHKDLSSKDQTVTVPTTPTKTTTVKTGDNSNLKGWLILLGVAAAGLAGIFLKKRFDGKRKEQK